MIHRRDVSAGVDNTLGFAVVALVGGLLFEVLRSVLGLARDDPGYAALVAPMYAALMALNLALVVMMYEDPEGGRRSLLRESTPMLPWEAFDAVIASVAVLVYVEAGLVAIASLLIALPISIALSQSVAGGIASGDDRDRLFEDLLLAERRERGGSPKPSTTVPSSDSRRCACASPRRTPRYRANSTRRSRRPAPSSRHSTRRQSVSSASRHACAPPPRRFRPLGGSSSRWTGRPTIRG